MNLLSTIGRGIRGAGRGILSGIDSAAQNSLTSGGLLDSALGQDGQPFTPTPQQKGAMRTQYLQGIFGAMQQGRPVGEGIQEYQQRGIQQIQGAQQAQQQAQSRQFQQTFNQELQAANGVEAKLAVVSKYAAPLGPAATKQYADAITSMRAPKEDAPFVPVGDLGYLNKQTGQFQAIPKPPGAPPTPERQTFDALVQKYNGDQTKAFAELQAMLKPQQPQREENPTEASLAMAAANGDPLKALQLLRRNSPQGVGDSSKLLSVTEAAQLGVPYGTTRAEASGKAPSTRQQESMAGYADRIEQANEQFARMEPDIAKMSAAGLWYGRNAPNFMKSEEMQAYDQLQRNFINAVLRQESGAVISKTEFDNAYRQYFPQPGDGEKVIAQKRQNRATVQQRFIKASGNAYVPPPQIQQQQGGENKPITRYNPATGRFEK